MNFLLQHLVLFAVGVLVGVAFLLGGGLLAQKVTGLAFRHLPTVRRCVLAGLAAALWLYGSVKPDGDGDVSVSKLGNTVVRNRISGQCILIQGQNGTR